ncbi:phosphotransferase [Tepidiforma sp.]|uniref:phosphotransferase n=1 Tax=Tepidiforma sp. TaxID=2682230 RepID=UPI0021DE02B3|nr:phosphotransferase [Tepidiforma sp.]MCX7617287.1 phosphotransferase [Tepidiforma sp.]GIW18643.1 MAG: hypothetical protein KatS3mg064_1800 [Tepidiforma sp.]
MREPPTAVLRAFGLGGETLQSVSRDGRVWLTGRGVLKRRRLPGPEAGLRWEAELRDAAARAGWPTARALAAADGVMAVDEGGRPWTCEERLPGEPRELTTVAAWRIAGRLLGRLHRDLAAADPGTQRPGLGKAWELDVLTDAAGAGTFNRLVAAFGREYPELAAAIRRERYRNLRELARLGYPELPEQPIHGDFSAKNLLWRDGELSGLVDWEFARRDAALCDLAPLLMPFGPLEPQFARALFEGYAAVRPVSNQEFGLLPALVRASLLWWVAVELIRWRLEGGPPERIARTMQVRFPAFERYALELGFLRENVRG